MTDRLLDLDLDTLRRRTSAKWIQYPSDVIPAWVAEMDVRVAAPVQAAVAEAMELGDTGYPRPKRYVGAFAGFADRHWSWGIDAQLARPTADVMMGILVLLLQTTGEGDAVVINDPVYPPFAAFPTLAGRRVTRAALTAEGRLDLDTLDAAFADAVAGGRRAAYLLCNPHNPTGVVHTEAELAGVAECAARHGVTVISDEIHAPIVYTPHTFVPYLQVPGVRDGFAVHSAAKTFSLAGLKAGLVIGTPSGQAVLDAIAVGPNASLSGVIAQSAAWESGDEWMAQLLTELDENRRYLVEQLPARLPGLRVAQPEGTYLLWLDCRELGLDADPSEFFLEHAKVALNPGPTFGPAGASHCRLNFATSPQILEQIVERMAGAVA